MLALVGQRRLSDHQLLVHASVNSLASFHPVIGPRAVCSPACTAFILFGLLNLKLRELIITCCTLSHNTLSTCTCRLLVLTNVVEASNRWNSFQRLQLDPCEQVSLVPRPIQVRSGYEANYNKGFNT